MKVISKRSRVIGIDNNLSVLASKQCRPLLRNLLPLTLRRFLNNELNKSGF